MKLLFDVTTTARSAFDPPVGTTRVERTVLADLYRHLGRENLTFINYDEGRFVHLSDGETGTLLSLIDSPSQQAQQPETRADRRQLNTPSPSPKAGLIRRIGQAVMRRYPEPYRNQARVFAIQVYLGMRGILGVLALTLRSARRGRGDAPLHYPHLSRSRPQAFNFSGHTDLITLGNGWDYLDYENLSDLKRKNGLRVHGFVHDLIAVEHPYYFYDPAKASIIHQHYAELCHVCETLVCNSFATRDALIDFIAHENLPSPRIVVAQLPVFASEALASERPPDFGDEPFILFVSTIEIRKNHRLLLNIWRECLREGKAMPRLVLVGRVGWGVDTVIEMIARDPVLRGHVTVLHDITDAQLAWLYDSCLFTVYPSVAEGWGLPIGEALGRGRICLHTTDPAQREAGQGLMPALHPEDFYGWKTAILDLIDRPARRARLEADIHQKFTQVTREKFCSAVREAIGL